MTIKKRYFDNFALECEYFKWGCEEEGTLDINGGYLCYHPIQEEAQVLNPKFRDENGCPDDIVGECHCYSCPLGIQDPEDEEKIIIHVE